ncbi:nucleotidyltransferase family protein [Kutzneria kofuensis]|uniref:Nicotine blue oxidoreductase n=1 Tax=Kutzneria kofuensis TaxID=103725 RepID=A0A7W9KAG7_9PSEU|nr:nucleotidyltransferase family protein [Kutzneria kofuensis]MBB5888886.1 nicotine blue oxidoreductase [Kutzneria kofuensis]
MASVAGLVLAAGEGRRYGMPKALVSHGGRLFVESTVDRLRAAGCGRIVVVAGAAAEKVREADLGDAEVVENPDWPSGMGSSLRKGIEALQGTAAQGVGAVAVMTVDLPGVTAEAIERVLGHATPDVLAAATYNGRRGHPVLIGREHWQGVHELAQGDSGARAYLRRHEVTEVACEDVADGHDVDRPEDLPR